MKKNIPESVVIPGHPDYELLNSISADIVSRAGGSEAIAIKFPSMLRECIDDVIMTPKTGRRSYDELEKTEKTYIGTRVEIELRAMLELPKGNLDTVILGHDVDIKNTMGSNWMIPTEAIDHPCILIAADESSALCYLGLFVAKQDYLTRGQNKDAKKSLSAEGFKNILWLLKGTPYPSNFWRGVSSGAVERIFEANSGNRRVEALFRELQALPITRDVIEAVAQQRDFMRRLRADDGKGARDVLAKEGILLLSGDYDSDLISALKLPTCAGSEFISYKPQSQAEVDLASRHGVHLVASFFRPK